MLVHKISDAGKTVPVLLATVIPSLGQQPPFVAIAPRLSLYLFLQGGDLCDREKWGGININYLKACATFKILKAVNIYFEVIQ